MGRPSGCTTRAGCAHHFAASSTLKAATVILSGASTIILGVQNLDFWAGLGFTPVALATVFARHRAIL
jgi:hypothetical protein